MIKVSPRIKNKNIKAINLFVPIGASLNSIQTKTPQNAATITAPCPNPYEMAGPAAPEAIILNYIPTLHITPPRIPMRCSLEFPLVK